MTTNKGFSLIEVMVSVIIVSFLIGVIVIKYQNSIGDAKVLKAKSELTAIKLAIAKYFDKYSAYPARDLSGNNLVDVKLKEYYDGSLQSSWLVSCEDSTKSTMSAYVGGVVIGAHHLPGDVMTRLVPEFQKMCAYGAGSISNDAAWGNYVWCRIKPVSELTPASGAGVLAGQCN